MYSGFMHGATYNDAAAVTRELPCSNGIPKG